MTNLPATCGLDFERHVSASSIDVRREISAAIQELGFEITVDQLTRIGARRGSMLGYSLLMKQKLPVQAVFEIALSDAGCGMTGHLTDNVKLIGKTWGLNHQYREIFEEVARLVDGRLARLDEAASHNFVPPRFWSQAADINVLEQGTAVTGKAVGGAVGVASKALEGSTSTTPKVWKGVDSVTFTSSAGVAVESLADAQADLGVAVLVVSHPGSMPPKLAHDVEAFAASFEQRLTAAGGHAVYVEVSDAQKPVLEFLHQQAQIRSELPLRELHICRICRLEKITNPEYQRLAKRNEKLGDIVAGVGATIGKGGISPTFVLGQVFKLKRLDPEYVCSRCQGMEADERIVTYCPKCADLQRDVVLRLCPKCGYDFRTKVSGVPFWQPPTVPAAQVVGAEAEPTEIAAAPVPGAAVVDAAAASAAVPVADGGAAMADGAAVAGPPAGPEPSPPVASAPLPGWAPPWPAWPGPGAGDQARAGPPTAPSWLPPAPASAPRGPLSWLGRLGQPKQQVPPPWPPVGPPPSYQTPPTPGAPPAPPAPNPQVAPPEAPVPPQPALPTPGAPPAPPSQPSPIPPAPPQFGWPGSPPSVAWPHPAQVPLGRPQSGSHGKVCQMCRREFPNLWRVVISTPSGYEERFLCGTTATCQMHSLVTAIQV